MIEIEVTLDNDLLLRLERFVSFSSAPATSAAVSEGARIVQHCWQDWAMGGALDGAAPIKRANGKLASSIKVERGGAFSASIGTDSPYMKRIQEGTPEVDMKKSYPYGNKSRVSKSGVPYLIIPFKWMTPNSSGTARAHSTMANTIDKKSLAVLRAKSFKKSLTTGEVHMEKNARGEDVPRANYSWGSRLKDSENPNEVGMVKTGEPRHTGYTTFRVITAAPNAHNAATWGAKWIRRAVGANDVVQAVEKACREKVEGVIEAGFLEDLGV